MNTALRITVFAAALAATFGTAYGVGNTVGTITPQPKGGHAMQHRSDGHHDDMASMPGMPGMDHDMAPGGLEISKDGYTLALRTSQVPAGKRTNLSFAVVRDGTGRNVTAYEREHGKELHLIVAARDLTVYRHLHPTRAVDGTWSTSVELPKAGGYRVIADFRPKGGEPLVLGADLAVSGPFTPAALPGHSSTAKVDGYEVSLAGTPVPGKATPLTLTVSKDGHPVRDLEPYLGAYGHLVALRSGDLAYLHVHPTGEPGDGTTAPGPKVSFEATAPSAGAYRLFFDFQHEGKVHTAAFTVHATGGAHEH
ncbi:hypothetical protein FRZ03_06395 [Streptomyces misionensis]|uniref:DUF748 domain-containing protein n=1 Tax=Streptomyces misionensis TaxID=67331 RepID=A0A5C6K236_9ACTN|nr:hypothetical protein [Streptomyces misionensis]TWV55788.1 hypothetical protein FRZ03_06395 [Streptomyces misionensis]